MTEKLFGEEEDSANTTEDKAQECLKIGREASKVGHFDAALGKLHEGRNLLKNGDHLELWLHLSNGLAETYYQAVCLQNCADSHSPLGITVLTTSNSSRLSSTSHKPSIAWT